MRLGALFVFCIICACVFHFTVHRGVRTLPESRARFAKFRHSKVSSSEAVAKVKFPESRARNVKYRHSKVSSSEAIAKVKIAANNTYRIRIIFWNTWFGKKMQLPNFHDDCSPETARKCEITRDRSLYNSSDVLIFYIGDPLRLPPESAPRPAHQKWVFYTRESSSKTKDRLPETHGLFNLTMTYKRTSSVVFGYGRYHSARNTSTSYDPRRNYATGKTKMVAWYASHCHTSSRRETYVRELEGHIDVDTYGSCGKYRCKRYTNCHDDLLTNTYKFYLSFENSLCTDYATEKVWDILKYPIVPIVLGRSNYTDILPPNSFIDVRDFASPKDLAAYLFELDKNDTLYNAYFSWKSDFQLESYDRAMCDACDYFHRTRAVSHTIDTERFWSEATNCLSPSQFYQGIHEYNPV